MSSEARFAVVVLDVDSTVAGIEGIDWLANRRGPDVAATVAALTREAMDARMPLEDVYDRRLALVAPTRDDIDALARAYLDAIAPGCVESLGAMRRAGVQLILVSGGILQAILPLASHLGIGAGDVHAVDVRFEGARYAGFDRASPLATSGGKRIVVERRAPARPVLGVGDGATDLEMKGAVDAFAVFTGFARRLEIIRHADVELRSFAELTRYVLPAATR
jgi:phosphoserine phosphatase